jgi:hypothetical protein
MANGVLTLEEIKENLRGQPEFKLYDESSISSMAEEKFQQQQKLLS